MISVLNLRACASVLAATAILATLPTTVDAGSRSRSEGRTTVTTEGESVVTSRSTTRRSKRSTTSADTTVVTRAKVRRGRTIGPKAEETAPISLAGVAAGKMDIWTAIGADQSALDKHVAANDFTGVTGALALFQLVEKAIADSPLNEAETNAVAGLKSVISLEDARAQAVERLTVAAELGTSESAEFLMAVAKNLGVADLAPTVATADPTS